MTATITAAATKRNLSMVVMDSPAGGFHELKFNELCARTGFLIPSEQSGTEANLAQKHCFVK
jgi:hypothetical protein